MNEICNSRRIMNLDLNIWAIDILSQHLNTFRGKPIRIKTQNVRFSIANSTGRKKVWRNVEKRI